MDYRRSIVAAAILVSASLHGHVRDAQAADPAPHLRLDYKASVDCPRETEFIHLLQTKARFELSTSDESVRTFVIELGREARAKTEPYRGKLLVRTARRAGAIREISGDECGQVAAALAVIVAIELGPEARIPTPPEPPATPPYTESPLPIGPQVPPILPSPPTKQMGIVLAAQLMSGLSDGASPGASLAFDWRSRRPTTMAPVFRASVEYVSGTRVQGLVGSVRLQLLTARLEGCPLQLRSEALGLGLEPCVDVTLGLRAAGGGATRDPNGASDFGPWLHVGVLLRLVKSLPGPFWFELAGEAFTPIFRDQFYTLTPATSVYEIPGVAYRGAVGIGAHFR